MKKKILSGIEWICLRLQRCYKEREINKMQESLKEEKQDTTLERLIRGSKTAFGWRRL